MGDAQILELIHWGTPYVAGFVGLVVSLLLKDIVSNFFIGMAFKRNPLFNEGDTVIIDGEYATIVRIGSKNTIFGIVKDDGNYVWRYVPNTRISHLKLEKVVREKQPENITSS